MRWTAVRKEFFFKVVFFSLSFFFSFESYHYQRVPTELCLKITWSDKCPVEELLELWLYCTTVLTSTDYGYLNCCSYMNTTSRKKFNAYVPLRYIWLKKHNF